MTLSIQELASSLDMDFDQGVLDEMELRGKAFEIAWAGEGLERVNATSPETQREHDRRVGSVVTQLMTNQFLI